MNGRFTSEQLKKIAMGTMFLDHAAATIWFGAGLNDISPLMENIGIAMRLIGRMAFPLYAFMLVQGFLWTRDWKRYALRLMAFALISEVPFDLMLVGEVWYPWAQNTIMTLLIGLICMRMLDTLEKKYDLTLRIGALRYNGEKILGAALEIWVVAAAMIIAEVLSVDYGARGILLIAVLYVFRYRPAELVIAGCLASVLIYGFSLEVLFTWIAFFFISRYNGERGRRLGMVPYVFYPAHLLLVWAVGELAVRFAV